MANHAHMQFPVVYVDFNDLDENEVWVVSRLDWCQDVDTHFAIGPNRSERQFFLDSAGGLFSLRFTGLVGEKHRGHVEVPQFETCPSDNAAMKARIEEYIARMPIPRCHYCQTPREKTFAETCSGCSAVWC